ncbi:MAG: hypothetical protein CGW95_06535 [Phenylobacterium zucineum]|nr:MAG: hypothetical protein CGW95_06535 [Phenylobacterium zucineum]
MSLTKTEVAKAVAEVYHAKYGASGWPGWGYCAQWIGGGAASLYAATGSVIHEVAAECLTSQSNCSDYIGKTYESDGYTIIFNESHAEIGQFYVDTMRGLHASLGGELLVEQGFDLEYLTKELGARSTLDSAIVPKVRGELLVCDLKTGAGVAVDAVNNGQGVIYAILAYDQYSMVTDITSVRIMIVQPPLNSVSEWVLSIEELEQWRTKVIEAATAAQAGNVAATPGEKQCRWCSKAATCTELNNLVFEAVEANDPKDIATDDLAEAMSKVEMIEGWIKSIRAETERRLLDGRTVAGWKLVQGKRGNRQWSKPADAEALLKSMRLKESDMYDFKLISPTTADKLAKAGTIGPKQWEKVQQLITQSEGAPSVAPESDKRPALVPGSIEFQPIETGVPE